MFSCLPVNGSIGEGTLCSARLFKITSRVVLPRDWTARRSRGQPRTEEGGAAGQRCEYGAKSIVLTSGGVKYSAPLLT